MLQRSLRYRAPILWLLLPLISGMVSGRAEILGAHTAWFLVLAGLGFTLSAGLSSRMALWALCFCCGGYFSGATLYLLTERRLAVWDNLPAREMRIHVRIDRVFAPRSESKRISALGVIVSIGSKQRTELDGQRIYVSVSRRKGDAPFLPSEILSLRGVLAPVPRQAELASFDAFLVNAGVHFRLSRARLIAVVQPPTAYRKFCDRTQQRLAAILERGLEKHAPLSAIYRGMVLGEATELSDEQNLWFRESGTMHLFSISGLHIAAIAVALHMFLGIFRLPRGLNLVATILFLWLYVDITGASPSAVRAFVMVALLETAFVLRRAVNPVATLSFAAFVSLLANPMQLFGASFQMSYGIVALLLLLGLPLAEAWQEKWILFRELPKVTWRWWHHALSWSHRALLSALGLGVSTSLISGICGVLYFKLLTPGALIANLVLIPASSLALWSGFLSLLFGLIGLGGVSHVFNHAAALTLLLMQKGIQHFLTIPGVFLTAEFKGSTFGYLALGGLVAVVVAGYAFHWDKHAGRWWPPFIWTAVALALGCKFG